VFVKVGEMKELLPVKVVFKNGVFVPLEIVSIPENSEGIVVCTPTNKSEDVSHWWDFVDGDKNWKNALKLFIEKIPAIVYPEDVKLVIRDDEAEVVVILENDETAFLNPLMEAGYRVYQSTGIFLPIQVISKRRLDRWREFERDIFSQIEKGISLWR